MYVLLYASVKTSQFIIAPLLSSLKAINCHAGLDYWSVNDKAKMFVALNQTNDNDKKQSLIISYETHRGRALNNPREYLDVLKEVNKLMFVSV